MATAERERPRWEAWLERLHDPLRLRIGLTAVVLVIAYVGVYWPFSERIAEVDSQLARDEKRLATAHDIEQMQARYRQVAPRIPSSKDSHEFVEYVLRGIQERSALRLVELKPEATTHVGPYQAAAVSLELEGSFRELSEFLRWLEVNPRLLRVDSVEIMPRQKGCLSMHMRIVGLMS